MASFGFRAVAVLAVVIAGAAPSRGFSPAAAVDIFTGPDGAAHIRLADGRTVVASKERGQVDIARGLIASDGTAGWLAEFTVAGVSYPVAQALVVWRSGKITRRFRTGQSFYSWAFYARGAQVAYHTGPLHGERFAHCELHDVANGQTVAVWNGDPESHTGRPVWTEDLTH